jgi:outer membrane protein assembly factor BamA
VGALLLLAPAMLLAQVADSAAARDSVAQKDIIDVIFRRRPAKPELYVGERFQASILPSASYNPAYGVSVSIGGAGVFRLGTPDHTGLSTFSASASYTTLGQFLVTIRSNVFLPRDEWSLQGDWRYWNTSQPTYGLGHLHPESEKVDMDFKLFRIYETAYKKIAPRLFAGIGYHFDDWYNIVEQDVAPGDTTPYGEWTGNSPSRQTTSGLSVNLLYDTRDNALNPAHGIYFHVALKENPSWLGSDNHWNAATIEVRAYPRLGPNTLLGVWVLSGFTSGHAPYLSLPALGWDANGRTGRGYVAGRVRGTSINYFETELRQSLTRDGLLGAVAFANFNSAAASGDEPLPGRAVGYGVGARVKLNKHSGTNIAIDFGRGAEHSKGLFLAINEAF